MKIDYVIKHFEKWAPLGVAWDKDNIGLQVGNASDEVTNILLSLDFDKRVFQQAVKKKCNFIITHHPFIFNPIKKLNFDSDTKSQLIKELIQNNISLYSAHTNLDYTKDGVSFELAKRIKLKNIKFLEPSENDKYKLSVFVPEENVEKVANAIFLAGGGIIGEYSKCSSQSIVKGTFEGSKLSNPTIGKANKFEVVNEVKLEVLINSWELNSTISKMKLAHPYEEPAFDVFMLKNKNSNYGAGAIGELEYAMEINKFLAHIKEHLKTDGLKYTVGNNSKIKKVAVCGGTCSNLLKNAIAQKSDAFITADVKYHTFQDAENKIMLIDAGHYETEVPVLDIVKSRLDKFVKNENSTIKVLKFSGSTNPIKFYN